MVVRLRNKDTGVIVGVDESKRERFGAEWVEVDAKPETVKRKPGRPKKAD